jgi:hypothetical protein
VSAEGTLNKDLAAAAKLPFLSMASNALSASSVMGDCMTILIQSILSRNLTELN